jgi:hypothetical protein
VQRKETAMSKRDRKLRIIERRWLARFGEVPSLRTDPAIMQRILDSTPERRRDEDAAP